MWRKIGVIGSFLRREDGPTAAEYALTAGLIIVAITAAVGLLGGVVSASFSTVSSMVS